MTLDAKPRSPRRRPKGDKRARTRAQLLEAARQLVREKGYEHTTLEEVARRAGMTSGAIYGNFKNRDQLFIALGHALLAGDPAADAGEFQLRREDARPSRGDDRGDPRAAHRGGGPADRHGARPDPRRRCRRR